MARRGHKTAPWETHKNKNRLNPETIRIRKEVQPYKGVWSLDTVGTNDIVGPRLRIKDLKTYPAIRGRVKKKGRGFNRSTKWGRGEGGYRQRAGCVIKPHDDMGGTTPMKESRPQLVGTMKRVKYWWDTTFVKAKLFYVLDTFKDGETVTMQECLRRGVIRGGKKKYRAKSQLAVLHVEEDLPVRKALHFKVGFMNPECRRIVEAMGGSVELLPRNDPIEKFPIAVRPAQLRYLFKQRWIRDGIFDPETQNLEDLEQLYATDPTYLKQRQDMVNDKWFQKRLQKLQLRKAAGYINTEEEEQEFLAHVNRKPIHPPPGFNKYEHDY